MFVNLIKRFTFCLGSLSVLLFSVSFKWRGLIVVLFTGNILSTIVSFDREQRKEYKIPVAITDSGTPRLTGVSILHIVIGDRNDNPMGPGDSDIFVYNYKVMFFFYKISNISVFQ